MKKLVVPLLLLAAISASAYFAVNTAHGSVERVCGLIVSLVLMGAAIRLLSRTDY